MLMSLTNTLQSPQDYIPPSSSKKSRKMLYTITAIAVIAFAAVTGTLFFTMNHNGGNNQQGDSIKFNVDATTSYATTYTTTVSAKNIGQNNLLLLWENPYIQSKTVVDFNQQTVWENIIGHWTEYPSAFNNISSTWSQMWNQLQGRNGTEVTYIDNNNTTIRLYNIQINPSLPDSLFAHTSNLAMITIGVIASAVIVSIALLIIFRKIRVRKIS
jgi:hypothetical protein